MLNRLGGVIPVDPEAHDLFLLGNQGPDPFFYALLTLRRSQMHRVGNLMQDVAIDASLDAFRNLIGQAADEQNALFNAYFCGYLCHFALDRNVHPLVDAQANNGLALDGEEDDEGSEGGEPGAATHAQIETDLDTMMLHRVLKRGIKRAGSNNDTGNDAGNDAGVSGEQEASNRNQKGDYRFIRETLAASKESLAAVSSLYSNVIETTYSEIVSPKVFAHRVRDMRLINTILYSSKRGKRTLVVKIERSLLAGGSSTAKRKVADNEHCLFTNSKNAPWHNPHTGEISTKSFDDLFACALEEALEIIKLHQEGADSSQLSKGLDFSGQPF
jgi:hypothetical protein